MKSKPMQTGAYMPWPKQNFRRLLAVVVFSFRETKSHRPQIASYASQSGQINREVAMNASQFMDKQILGLAAAGAASPPHSGGGGGSELFDLMGPNPQEDDVVESHDHLHARRGATGADEVMMPSYDFQSIRTAAAPAAPAPAASSSAQNAWGSLDSNAASPDLKVIILGYIPADGAAW